MQTKIQKHWFAELHQKQQTPESELCMLSWWMVHKPAFKNNAVPGFLYILQQLSQLTFTLPTVSYYNTEFD